MAIEFSCEHCGKTIRTGDEHAGKRGRCPACHQSVYIPTPSDQVELLDLAPLDENEERRKARLMQETRELTRKLLTDRDKLPPEPAGAAGGGRASASHVETPPPPKMDAETLAIEYAIAMADGDLATADEMARELRKNMAVAEQVIQRMLLDEMPHAALAKIPRPVLVGFFKQLREKK